MNKKYRNIAIILVAMFLMSSCDSKVIKEDKIIDDKVHTIERETVYRFDMEKEKKYINQLKKEKYEKLLELEIENKILQNTYYIKYDNTAIYSDVELTTKINEMDSRNTVYVEEINDEYGIFKVKTDYYSKQSGYLKTDRLHVDILDFIKRKYSGVDYELEIPVNDYEFNKRVKAKGIYLTLSTVTNEKKLDYLIKMAKETEINAFVIDVKNDAGTLLFRSDIAEKYNPNANNHFYTKNLESIMKKLKDNDIYTIARIVTFKSPQYALANPEKAITYVGTSNVYRNGGAWASAYDRDLWDYNIEIAKEAIEYGFNEIQFDYVRFPALSKSVRQRLDMKNNLDENRSEAIHNFLVKAYAEISSKEAYLSADIFGWAASSISDEGIGQHWEALVTTIDYSCPMMYPSHYGTGIFGLAVPDANPYKTIYGSATDAIERNTNLKNAATLRPWIQDFTAGWVNGHIHYGVDEVKAQIDALSDLGINEYILWSPGNNYTWEALK